MQTKIIGLIFFTLFFITSCEEEEVVALSQESQQLVGYWVNQQLSDTCYTYEKAENLVAHQYGFAFLPDGKFIERKNSGWCGTPPIAYADYEGSWFLNDSIVNVTVGYWGGMVNYQWKVLSVNNERLVIEVFSEDYSLEN